MSLIEGLSTCLSTVKCGNPVCCKTMIGPLPIKVLEARIPNLSDVNDIYWRYKFEKHVLEGLGYVCPARANTRIIKIPNLDNETGMIAWD